MPWPTEEQLNELDGNWWNRLDYRLWKHKTWRKIRCQNIRQILAVITGTATLALVIALTVLTGGAAFFGWLLGLWTCLSIVAYQELR